MNTVGRHNMVKITSNQKKNHLSSKETFIVFPLKGLYFCSGFPISENLTLRPRT